MFCIYDLSMSTSVLVSEEQLLKLTTWEFNGRSWILGGEYAAPEVCPEPGTFRLESWTIAVSMENGELDPCTQDCFIIKFLSTDVNSPETRKKCIETVKKIAEERGLFEPDFELSPFESSEMPLLVLMDSWNHWTFDTQDIIGATPPWVEEVDCKAFFLRKYISNWFPL